MEVHVIKGASLFFPVRTLGLARSRPENISLWRYYMVHTPFRIYDIIFVHIFSLLTLRETLNTFEGNQFIFTSETQFCDGPEG